MKRWEYNTLRGELFLFFIYLGIMVFEILAVFYIIFFAEPAGVWLAVQFKSPEAAGLLKWLGRLLAVLYMLCGVALFSHFSAKNAKL